MRVRILLQTLLRKTKRKPRFSLVFTKSSCDYKCRRNDNREISETESKQTRRVEKPTC